MDYTPIRIASKTNHQSTYEGRGADKYLAFKKTSYGNEIIYLLYIFSLQFYTLMTSLF
jgi:hypothetical protein